MAICKFFQQGTCKFGNRCRFEHVFTNDGDGYSTSSGTSVFNRNKLTVQSPGNSFFNQGPTVESRSNTAGQFPGTFFNQAAVESRSSAPGQFPGSFFSQAASVEPRSSAPVTDLTRDVVQMVITELMLSEKGGQWPLSCFAPFKEHGCFPGLEDHSPEELRYLVYEAVRMNNLEECTRKVNEFYERNSAIKKQIFSRTSEVVSIVEKLFKGEKIDSFSNSLFTSQQTPAVTNNFTFALPTGGSGNGTSQTIFGDGSVSHSSSIFAAPSQGATNQSMFNSSNHNSPISPFRRGLESSPSFQQSTPTSFFNQPSKGIFSGNTATPNQGIFGDSNTNQSPGIFSGNPSTWNQADQIVSEDTVYTALSELTEEEKNIFNSKTFTMGKVPIKAPSKEQCF